MKIIACESCKGQGVRHALPCRDCNAKGTVRMIETEEILIEHVLSLPEPAHPFPPGLNEPPRLYVVRTSDTPETQT